MWRSAISRRTSFDASSSAWPGATSALKLIENWRFVRVICVGPKPRLRRAMLSMRTGAPVDRRHRQLADRRRCRAAGFRARGSSPGTARPPRGRSRSRRRPPPSAAACCRPSPSARRDPRRARDRPRPAPPGWRCCSRSSRRPGSACCLRLLEDALRVVVELVDVGPEQRRVDGEAPPPPPPPDSGLRADTVGLAPGCFARILPDPRDHLLLRDRPLVDRQQIEEDVESACSGRRRRDRRRVDTPS